MLSASYFGDMIRVALLAYGGRNGETDRQSKDEEGRRIPLREERNRSVHPILLSTSHFLSAIYQTCLPMTESPYTKKGHSKLSTIAFNENPLLALHTEIINHE
jgi:hypothetical protein